MNLEDKYPYCLQYLTYAARIRWNKYTVNVLHGRTVHQ